LMYPQVFAEFSRHQREFSDVSVLPTPAFFYGLKIGEETTISIEEGKTLFVKLVNVSAPDKDARRTVTFELNGMTREAHILDKTIAPKARPRPKADLADPLHIAAPIPGLIVTLSVSVGQKVAKGDKLMMMEAMKMQTTIYSSSHGVVETLHVQVGDTVESKDLLARLRS
jgi:pyruvate carboxylase